MTVNILVNLCTVALNKYTAAAEIKYFEKQRQKTSSQFEDFPKRYTNIYNNMHKPNL